MTPRFPLRVIPALAVVTALGCGLADYEDRMKKGQERADRFDEEIRLLEKPAELPVQLTDKSFRAFNGEQMPRPVQDKLRPLKDKPMGKKAFEAEVNRVLTKDELEKWRNSATNHARVDLFLPLPRGVKHQFEDVPINGVLFQYLRVKPPEEKKGVTGQPTPPQPAPVPPPQGQPAVPGTPNPPGATAPLISEFVDVFLTWSREPEKLKYQESVLRQFPQRAGQKIQDRKISLKLPERPAAVEFDTYEFFDDKDNYCSVCFRTRETPKEEGLGKDYLHVCVAFKVDAAKLIAGQGNTKQLSPDAFRTQQFCLEWLSIDDEAAPMRKKYEQRLQKPMGPANPTPGPQPVPAPGQPGLPTTPGRP